MGPKYALDKVHEAAREGRVSLDEPRARDLVLLHFDTLFKCYPFAAEVLLELGPSNWRKTVRLGPPHAGEHDEYGITISIELAKKHGVDPRDWYLKLQLREDELSGQSVFLVSLHVAEWPLKPQKKEGAR